MSISLLSKSYLWMNVWKNKKHFLDCGFHRKILEMHEDGAICHALFTTNSLTFFDACMVQSSLIVTVKATEGNARVE